MKQKYLFAFLLMFVAMATGKAAETIITWDSIFISTISVGNYWDGDGKENYYAGNNTKDGIMIDADCDYYRHAHFNVGEIYLQGNGEVSFTSTIGTMKRIRIFADIYEHSDYGYTGTISSGWEIKSGYMEWTGHSSYSTLLYESDRYDSFKIYNITSIEFTVDVNDESVKTISNVPVSWIVNGQMSTNGNVHVCSGSPVKLTIPHGVHITDIKAVKRSSTGTIEKTHSFAPDNSNIYNYYYLHTYVMKNMPDYDLELMADYEGTPDATFDLWVGGTQVSGANMANVLGNGYVTYNPLATTLTLKGGTIQGNNTESSFNQYLGCGIYSEVDGLTIDVQGNTTVQGDDDYEGIYLKGNSTITGTAQLTAKGYNGILAGVNTKVTNLTIEGDVTLIAEGIGSGGFIGLARTRAGQTTYYTNLTIKGNTTVKAKGNTSAASIGGWADFTLDSCHEITAPSGAKWNTVAHEISYANGNCVAGEWVVIERTSLRGDVNLDGTVDIADAVCVLNAMAGQSVAGDANVNGDYNSDGDPVIDIADLVTVLNIMAGQ